MRKTTLALGLAVALATAVSFAAPGYGPGYGGGNGPCASGNAAACPGPGSGPGAGGGPGSGPGAGGGQGYGRGRMGGGFGPGGGSLMTDEERAAHREAMHSFTTVEQCEAYWTGHRAAMTARAAERGIEPGPGPRVSPCERMGNRGFLKRGS